MNLSVSEVFGPTWQGEGPSAGEPCMFLRLARCNLDCSWCDTPYTWDWTGRNGTKYDPTVEVHRPENDELYQSLTEPGVELIVLTGGEPLLQQRRLVPLLQRLVGAGHRIEVETNGTVAPTDQLALWVHRFVVSPKMANSGVAYNRAILPDVLAVFNAMPAKAVLKFVVATVNDVGEAGQIATMAPDLQVWVMPEGRDPATLVEHLRAVRVAAMTNRFRVSTRLQIEVFGDERGT